MLTGISVSPGLALAEAVIIRTDPVRYDRAPVNGEDVSEEEDRFSGALRTTVAQLEGIIAQLPSSQGEDTAAIFAGHRMFLEDEEFFEAVMAKIQGDRLRAAAAVEAVMEEHAAVLEALDDGYQRARAADIRDLSNRLVRNCLGRMSADFDVPDREVILVAHDLTPSQAAVLDRTTVKGLITECGSSTSHTAILAASMGIPAIVGVHDALRCIQEGDLIALDAQDSKILLNPTPEQLEHFERLRQAYALRVKGRNSLRHQHAVTTDGVCITLTANIGSPSDISLALEQGAEGVGLYRMEFLFMGRDQMPDEEDLYQAFRTVVEGMPGMPVVIRILDVGGDKNLPYLDLAKEDNPFLGCRGIRLCPKHPEVFLPQLRALLRAGRHGDLRILVPMISSVDEVLKFKDFLCQARQSLEEEGVPHADHLPLGIMVETPAAVYLAPHLIREVDFFSIGTNDLTQYTLAVDRSNERIADLYDSFSPAVLLSIEHAVDVARSHKKAVCVCGQMAGNVRAALLLVGMGVEVLSMDPGYIPRVKQALCNYSQAELRALTRTAVTMATAGEVREMLGRFLEERAT